MATVSRSQSAALADTNGAAMAAVLGAGIGSFAMGAFVLLNLHRRPDAAFTRMMAAASILLWIAVLVAGRFIGFLVG